MRGFVPGILSGVVFLAAVPAATAESKFDPRDPSIWHEKSDNPLAQEIPCEVFSSAVCPAWEDEKSDLQRERERREQRRDQALYERP